MTLTDPTRGDLTLPLSRPSSQAEQKRGQYSLLMLERSQLVVARSRAGLPLTSVRSFSPPLPSTGLFNSHSRTRSAKFFLSFLPSPPPPPPPITLLKSTLGFLVIVLEKLFRFECPGLAPSFLSPLLLSSISSAPFPLSATSAGDSSVRGRRDVWFIDVEEEAAAEGGGGEGEEVEDWIGVELADGPGDGEGRRRVDFPPMGECLGLRGEGRGSGQVRARLEEQVSVWRGNRRREVALAGGGGRRRPRPRVSGNCSSKGFRVVKRR